VDACALKIAKRNTICIGYVQCMSISQSFGGVAAGLDFVASSIVGVYSLIWDRVCLWLGGNSRCKLRFAMVGPWP